MSRGHKYKLTLAALLVAELGFGQINPFASASAGPRAKTRDELDRVGLVYEALDAAATVTRAEAFAKDYPDSEFLEFVRLAEMDAHLELADRHSASEAAQAVLQIQPENIHALITLAEITAEEPTPESERAIDTRHLAKEQVRRALTLLDKLAMPQGARSREWFTAKKELLAHAHSVLGYLLLKEKDPDGALKNLVAATQLDPMGIYFYRCGIAYSLAGQRQRAVEAFEEARRLGPPEVSAYAERRLGELAEPDRSQTQAAR